MADVLYEEAFALDTWLRRGHNIRNESGNRSRKDLGGVR